MRDALAAERDARQSKPAYRAAARKKLQNPGAAEVRQYASVQHAHSGAFVDALVWVSEAEAKQAKEE